MEFLKLVKERRSIRKYQAGKEISVETIEEILRTTMEAPTWKNSATGRYYIATTPEAIEKVRGTLAPFNQKNTANVSAFVVTAFEKNISGFTKGEPDNELGNLWGAYDLGLQNSYFILRAQELGIDSLIMGLRDGAALREALDIPETQEVVSVIALGYREGDAYICKRKEIADVAKFF